MYINHLTLSTGHISRIERGQVSGEALGRVAPWVAVLAASGKAAPLPVSGLDGYTALASVADGALILTVSGLPPESGPMRDKAPPLVTLGVAKRSRHGAALWPLLTEHVMPLAKRGLARPSEPWCGVVIWPTLMMYPSANEWLGDFERCIAWAWCTRSEDES